MPPVPPDQLVRDSIRLVMLPARRAAQVAGSEDRCRAWQGGHNSVMTLYQHIRHPRMVSRLAEGPVKVIDLLPRGNAVNRFNTKVAIVVTTAVGSMWCAYAFAAFDLLSLPSAIHGGINTIVQWVAQTFLQLVLLSIIMVGQNVQADAADKRSEATYHDASATLHEVAHVQGHLAAQDLLLTEIAKRIGIEPVPVIDTPAIDQPGEADTVT
jgi:hypothetical protein